MTDLFSDWVALPVYIGLPIYYLLTDVPFSAEDELFYGHITRHSKIFPPGRWRLVFPIAWSVFYVLLGVAGYFFWHDADPASSKRSLGLAFHWIGLLLSFGWMDVFFRRRMPIPAFLMTLGILVCAIGIFVCAIILEVGVTWGCYIPYLAWLIYATIMGLVAAFVVPVYPKDKSDEDETSSVLGGGDESPNPFSFSDERQMAADARVGQGVGFPPVQQQQPVFRTGVPQSLGQQPQSHQARFQAVQAGFGVQQQQQQLQIPPSSRQRPGKTHNV